MMYIYMQNAHTSAVGNLKLKLELGIKIRLET